MTQSARQRGPVVADSHYNNDAYYYSYRGRSSNVASSSSPRKLPPFPFGLINTQQTQWNRTTTIIFWMGVGILAMIIIAPIILLERMNISSTGIHHPASLHALVDVSESLRTRNVAAAANTVSNNNTAPAGGGEETKLTPKTAPAQSPGHDSISSSSTDTVNMENIKWMPAKRGHIQRCDVNVDDNMVYWSDPQSSFDQYFRSPFLAHDNQERFLTFELDMDGDWNSIRMSLEILFVFAAATGRTLVLPPPTSTTTTTMSSSHPSANTIIASLFPLDHPELRKHVKVITMKEFIQTQASTYLSTSLTEDQIKRELVPLADTCNLDQQGSDNHCDKLNVHLRKNGFQPALESSSHCFLFDETYYLRAYTKGLTYDSERIGHFCGNRTAVAYAAPFSKYKWIHWQASDSKYRLYNHFYTFLHFTNETVGNHYKRLVRDFLHYKDDIFCAAGKVVQALNNNNNIQNPDSKDVSSSWSAPVFSAMHIRRGNLPFHEFKSTIDEWVENTKPIFHQGEVLFITTDEHNKTFFEPFIKQGYQVRFLDEFFVQHLELSKLDTLSLEMIDSIVASHGRAFVGTWSSTFSSYIHRMRGYLGYDMKTSWYGSLLPQQQSAMHNYEYPHFPWYIREWPLGWEGIDEAGASWGSAPSPQQQGQADQVTRTEREDRKDEKHVKTTVKPRSVPNISLTEIGSDMDFVRDLPLARGVAGRPMSQTPALNGARRAHIECDVNVDSLVYWNNPQGDRDINFESPYKAEGGPKYISFAPDSGGWNNIRMSMEIIFVIAAATGRILVLPPKEPLYLLQSDKKNKYRGFGDFFPLHAAEFQRRVPTISTEEFVRREGGTDGRLPIPEANKTRVLKSVQHCEQRLKSEDSCVPLRHYLETVGYVPRLNSGLDCVIFDEEVVQGKASASKDPRSVNRTCGKRNYTYWTSEMQKPILIHFKADVPQTRLLAHFYGFIHFTNSTIDHYYKRFVRDFLHYNDVVYCAAGKIVKALQVEAQARGFQRDATGNGGYSAMHIRRGDFQFKLVKLSAEEWYNNTKELWQPNEIIYIATDERNKTFFDPIAEHHELRYLDDYWQFANLSQLDPNYMGMIDTIVSSRGRIFAGTWFSTFSGYINRMRGYHGIPMNNSWYSWLPRKEAVHKWDDSDGSKYAFEWPSGWAGIDADTWPSRDVF